MANARERGGGGQLSEELLAQLLGVNNLRNSPTPKNSNINSRDYASLLLNGQPGVTGKDPDYSSGLTQLMGKSIGVQGDTDTYKARILAQLKAQKSLPERGSSVDLSDGGGDYSQEQWKPIQLPQFDPTKFRAQAKGMVDAQYNPLIQAILADQGASKTRAKNVQGDISDLYSDLGKFMGQQQGVNYQAYEQLEDQNAGAYKDQRNELAALYAQASKEQQAQAQALGTGNLGVSETLAQQQSDQLFNQGQAQNQQQAEQAAFDAQQAAALNYDKSATGAAFAEGAGRQVDIADQLAEYLSKSNMQLADTRSQAAGSVDDLMMQLAKATYDRDVTNTQFGYQQQRDQIGDANQLAEYDMQMQKAQLDNQLAQQKLTSQGSNEKLSPWQQVASFAQQLQPQQAPDIVSALQQAMQSNPAIYSPDPDGARMNPAMFAKLVLDSAGGDNVDQNSLAMVAQELYRLLYGTG